MEISDAPKPYVRERIINFAKNIVEEEADNNDDIQALHKRVYRYGRAFSVEIHLSLHCIDRISDTHCVKQTRFIVYLVPTRHASKPSPGFPTYSILLTGMNTSKPYESLKSESPQWEEPKEPKRNRNCQKGKHYPKWTVDQLRDVLARREKGESYREIARAYNRSMTTIMLKTRKALADFENINARRREVEE